MKNSNLNIWVVILSIGLMFQSCTNENDITGVDLAEEIIANRGNNNNQGGHNHNDNSIEFLDNDIVEDWTTLLLEIERFAGGMRPNATARALAYINLASYETAVPGMRKHTSTKEILQGLIIEQQKCPKRVDYEIALNACFANSIDHFIINLPSIHDQKIADLRDSKFASLEQGLPSSIIENSKTWGRYVSNQIISYAQSDEEAEQQILSPQPLSYEPPTGDGFWTYSEDPERALFPYWKSVRTFVIGPNETTSIPPIEYSENPNSPYFKQMKEVYEINNKAKEEDNEQLWIAEFWSDDAEGLVFSPPARQYAISNQLIDKYALDLEKTLVLYLKLGFALNDGAVSTWKQKYDHMVMRPNVFIHQFIDPDYQTNLFRLIYWANPSFPGYPSGHSCFASAAAGVFIDFFGNQTNFTDRSHEGREEFRSTPRSFSSFTQLANENGYSRIPLGVHIRMDCAEGLRLGYEISDAVNDLNLTKKPNHG